MFCCLNGWINKVQKKKIEYRIRKRFQNQPMQADPAYPTHGFDACVQNSPIIKNHQYYPLPYKIHMGNQTRSWDFPPNYQQATKNKHYKERKIHDKERFQCAFSVCEGDVFLSMEDVEKHMLGIHGVLEDDITSKNNVDQDLDVDDVIDGACRGGYISMSQMATAQGTKIFLSMEDKEKHMLGTHGVLEEDITSMDNIDQDLNVDDDVIDGACEGGYISMSQLEAAQGTPIQAMPIQIKTPMQGVTVQKSPIKITTPANQLTREAVTGSYITMTEAETMCKQ